jgi:hypothetical protein
MPKKKTTEKKFIYVVTGSTGEYSDRREWTVFAFMDEKKALDFADECEKEADRLNDERGGDFGLGGKTSKYDPFIQMDYTGTVYFVEQVELKE